MTLDHSVISIMTYLGWIMLAKGKSSDTDILRAVHGKPGAFFLYIFILSLIFHHLSFKFTKETKICF